MLKFILLICLLQLFACQVDPNKIANPANLYKSLHKTKNFIITSYSRNLSNIDINKPLYIYIEGDGQAWISKHKLSKNPTPHDPLTLKLASLDKRPNVIYIARPCQFTPLYLDLNCHSKYWSTARYSEPVIEAVNEVINYFINSDYISNKNKEIHLIGYSGGATVAGIIASQRPDVKSLITIAGNLDHDTVSDFHNTSKLKESLNLINFTKELSHIPQKHYIGENDQIIPIYVIKNFVNKINYFNKTKNIAKYIIVKNTDHYNGWLTIVDDLNK